MNLSTILPGRSAARATSTLGVLVLLAVGLSLATGRSADAVDPATTTPIKHLVVIYDENESFDHYFGTYPHATNSDGVRFTAAAGTPTPKNLLSDHAIAHNPNSTNPFRLKHSQALTCDQHHSYNPEQQAMNWRSGRALMNRFPEYTSSDTCSGAPYARAGLSMGYFDGNTVTGLWNYAQNYAMSDNFWANTFGPSTPGALEVVSGQTWGAKAYDPTAPDDVANPTPATTDTPVTAVDPATRIGTLISDPDPVWDDCSNHNHSPAVASNVAGMTGKNIGDLLNAKSVTWGWFQGGFAPQTAYAGPGTYAQCTAARANTAGQSQTDYSPHHNPFSYYYSTSNPHHLAPSAPDKIGQTDQANHNYDLTDFDTTLQAGNLPAVSYLKAPKAQDAHPGNSDPLDEQKFLVKQINAIESSPQWSSTAIIVTYDDSDGWYDHVAPRITNSSSTGNDAAICKAAAARGVPALGGQMNRCGPSQRLPFVVISPFARRNFIDHTHISQASVVRFIEDNWGLGTIGDGSFDASAGRLDYLFDFQHPQQRRVMLNNSGTVRAVSSATVPAAGGSATSLTSAAVSATYGHPAPVPVTATSAGDVTGGWVTSTIDGRRGPSLPMTAAHRTLRLPATLAAGSHHLRLAFSGSADTTPATTVTTVRVAKASVKVHAKAGRRKHGKVKVTFKVIERGSTVAPIGTIKGRLNGKRFKAIHVRHGVAHVKLKVRAHKRNRLTFTFKGVNYHAKKGKVSFRR